MNKRAKRSEQGSSEPHLFQMIKDRERAERVYEEQILRMKALRIIKEKKEKAYNPDQWSLNPFHMGPTPIFALGQSNHTDGNLFQHMREVIKSHVKGTAFEHDLLNDYNAFSKIWQSFIPHTHMEKLPVFPSNFLKRKRKDIGNTSRIKDGTIKSPSIK